MVGAPATTHPFGRENFFPTCQVRVVRFMSVACSSSPLLLLLVVLLVQLRSAIHSVLCRTSTTTIHAQCSLPDLNREYPCQVFPAGPQPRPSPPSVPCRTSTWHGYSRLRSGREHHDHPRPVFPTGPQPRVLRQVFPAGPHVGRYGTKNVQKKVRKNVHRWTSTAR